MSNAGVDCLFCRIVAGHIPCDKLYEDEHVLAFRDIQPQAPEHFLIIPKRHIATLDDIEDTDAELIGRLFAVNRRITRQLNLAGSGYRTVLNCRGDGGQLVFHIHLHVLAGRRMTWPPG